MRRSALFLLLALADPAAAQPTAAPDPVNVRVTARVVVVDREALSRAGLGYVVLGHDRIEVVDRRGRSGVRVGAYGVAAFLELARERRWVRSESTQRVLTLTGSSAVVSSQNLAVGPYATRTRGPSLVVSPTVLEDGRVHLAVSAGHEDRVRYGWGHGVDGSPARVDTEVVVQEGAEVVLASSSSVRSIREAGLLGWSEGERGRDVLVSTTVDVGSARVR